MKKHSLLKALCFLVFCFTCPDVFAALFEVVPTDKSKSYLGMIFGGSVGNISLGGTFNSTLSLMFERFNFIMVTILTTVLFWTGTLAVINTAREGEALGKKLSMWTLLRSFIGALLMVPGPASGYSLVQMMVMWVVLNGIGAGNQIWNVVLGQLSQNVVAVGTSIGLTASNQQLMNLSHSVLNANTCMYALNSMTELSNAPGPFRQYQPVKIYTVTNNPDPVPPDGIPPAVLKQTATLYVGLEGAKEPYKRLCGEFTVEAIIDKATSKDNFNFSSLSQRLAIKVAALQGMFSALDSATQILATSTEPPSPGYIYASSTAYVSQIVNLATGVKEPRGANANAWETESTANPVKDNYAIIQSYGWIHAGSYYFTMVKAARASIDPDTMANAAMPRVTNVPETVGLGANNLPLPNGQWATVLNQGGAQVGILDILNAGAGQTTRFNNALARAANYWTTDSPTTQLPTKGIAANPASTGSGLIDRIVQGVIGGFRDIILNYMMTITAGGGDPLVSIGKFGWELMLAGELTIIVSMVTTLIISMISSIMACVNPAAYAVNMFFMWISPLIYGIALALWTTGATMGLYLPMVPYIVFTTAGFGWFIAVIEAVVAAPILALGLAHPSGEELGKATSGLVILANLFLRPTLMIFGFVLAASLLRAGIALVNFGFIAALTEGTLPTLFSIIGVVGMYTGLMMMLVNKSFSLIHVLPNQIFRWLGGGAEAGGGAEEMSKEALGKAEGGVKQGGEAFGAASKKAQEGSAATGEKVREQGQASWDKAGEHMKQQMSGGFGGGKKGGGAMPGSVPPAPPLAGGGGGGAPGGGPGGGGGGGGPAAGGGGGGGGAPPAAPPGGGV